MQIFLTNVTLRASGLLDASELDELCFDPYLMTPDIVGMT